MNNMTDEMSNFKGKQVNYDASYEAGRKVIGLGQDLIKEDGALRHRAPAAPAVAPTLEPIEPAASSAAPVLEPVTPEATPVTGEAPDLTNPLTETVATDDNKFVPPTGALPEETDAYAEAQKFMNEGEAPVLDPVEAMEPAAVPVTEPEPVPEVTPEVQAAAVGEITENVLGNNTDLGASVEVGDKPEIISIDRAVLKEFTTQLEELKESNLSQNNKIDYIIAAISKALEEDKNLTPVIEEAAEVLDKVDLPPAPEAEVPAMETLGAPVEEPEVPTNEAGLPPMSGAVEEAVPPIFGAVPEASDLPPTPETEVPAMETLGAPVKEPEVPANEAGLPPIPGAADEVVPPVLGAVPEASELPPFPVETKPQQTDVPPVMNGMQTPPPPGYTQPFAM